MLFKASTLLVVLALSFLDVVSATPVSGVYETKELKCTDSKDHCVYFSNGAYTIGVYNKGSVSRPCTNVEGQDGKGACKFDNGDKAIFYCEKSANNERKNDHVEVHFGFNSTILTPQDKIRASWASASHLGAKKYDQMASWVRGDDLYVECY